MSNRQVKALLKDIKRSVDLADSKPDLLDTVQKAIDFGQPVAFNYTRHIVIAVLCICISALLIAGIFWRFLPATTGIYDYVNESLVASAILMLMGVGVLGYVVFQNKKIGDLSARIFKMDAMLDNHFVVAPSPGTKSLQTRFSDFDRGNYSREIRSYYHSHYDGEEHDFDFNYYHFHYVNKRTVTYTTTDSKGRTQVSTKTVYDHFDRYGIILPFTYVRGIQIFESSAGQHYQHQYSAESLVFRKRFNVYCRDQFSAAKFLKPAVIVAIEDIAGLFKQLNIEINVDGQMCIAFDNADLLGAEQSYDLEHPQAFLKELKGETQMVRLNSMLSFVHQLMRHSDSNF
ncbi:DUF3137 domain-containing protein [Aliiglaciecola sp. M165]|uniref:DUF3137 domain-containing protein n=1 Tax=Aliiglaciecola sp. M165 TaxID=2593649 RepID=UPI00117F5AB7|nr:DUF3137 domain-containing protein [Aliiglaciecola sp. M165]TRY32911.1 DUF3137 domain-containing protein [Aliiglaciecola sp. M165]